MQRATRDHVDIIAPALDVQSLAGNGERILHFLGDDGDHDVGVGQQHSIRVFNTHQHLADEAGSVGDDGGGQADDVPVEFHVRFGIPHNADRIVELQVADLGFVESRRAPGVWRGQPPASISASGLDIPVSGGGKRINGSGEGGAHIGLRDDLGGGVIRLPGLRLRSN